FLFLCDSLRTLRLCVILLPFLELLYSYTLILFHSYTSALLLLYLMYLPYLLHLTHQCLLNIVFIASLPFRIFSPIPPNSNLKNASAAFSNSAPYRYHHGFSTPFNQSTSTYFTFTISSNPAFPCARPHPLNLHPPCGASAIANPLITSFTITVPAFNRRAISFPTCVHCPHARRQRKLRIIRSRQRLFRVLHHLYRHDRPKRLVLEQ